MQVHVKRTRSRSRANPRKVKSSLSLVDASLTELKFIEFLSLFLSYLLLPPRRVCDRFAFIFVRLVSATRLSRVLPLPPRPRRHSLCRQGLRAPSRIYQITLSLSLSVSQSLSLSLSVSRPVPLFYSAVFRSCTRRE